MQYDEVNSYFGPRPEFLLGGVRYAMNHGKVRSGYVGHALSTLSKYRDARAMDLDVETPVMPVEVEPKPPGLNPSPAPRTTRNSGRSCWHWAHPSDGQHPNANRGRPVRAPPRSLLERRIYFWIFTRMVRATIPPVFKVIVTLRARHPVVEVAFQFIW